MHKRLDFVYHVKEQFVVVRDLTLKLVEAQNKLMIQELKEVIDFGEWLYIPLIIEIIFWCQKFLESFRILGNEKRNQEFELLDWIVKLSIQEDDWRIKIGDINFGCPFLDLFPLPVFPIISYLTFGVGVIKVFY